MEENSYNFNSENSLIPNKFSNKEGYFLIILNTLDKNCIE